MVDVIQTGKSDAQRIADRLKGSNDTSTADTIVIHGKGPTRVVHSVHHSGSAKQHGPTHSGEGNIVGGKR
jgi:hypothetical protein